MPSTSSEPAEDYGVSSALSPKGAAQSGTVIAWSSFFFALLQSICGAIIALNSLRLAIGIGSLALSTGVGAAMVRFHADAIRLPMTIAALLGSLLNLAVLAHARYLRNRPAAQWRMKPLSLRRKNMERLQVLLSMATLVLLAVEECLHLRLHHSL